MILIRVGEWCGLVGRLRDRIDRWTGGWVNSRKAKMEAQISVEEMAWTVSDCFFYRTRLRILVLHEGSKRCEGPR